MKGIDIIEAMGNIDEEMILHARQHRKAIPIWLRWASVAAVLLCTVILAALMLSRLLGGPQGVNPDPDQPDMLVPGIAENQEESSEGPAESGLKKEQVSPAPDQTPATIPAPIPSAKPTPTPTSEPTPEPTETPEPVSDDDMLRDETLFSVGGVRFGMNDTEVEALLGEPDSSEDYDTEGGKVREYTYFGTISYRFSPCETCGEYHLFSISEISGGNRLYPYGITLDDNLYDVLEILDAEDLDITKMQDFRTLDNSHYVSFQPLYDNPNLHFLNVYIGDIVWELGFGREDQLYINSAQIPPEYSVHSIHLRQSDQP